VRVWWGAQRVVEDASPPNQVPAWVAVSSCDRRLASLPLPLPLPLPADDERLRQLRAAIRTADTTPLLARSKLPAPGAGADAGIGRWELSPVRGVVVVSVVVSVAAAAAAAESASASAGRTVGRRARENIRPGPCRGIGAAPSLKP